MKQTETTEPSQTPVGERSSALDRLTGKQRAFVIEYMKDFNATRAAKVAGYSSRCAAELGYATLRNVHVAEAVTEQLAVQGIAPDRIKTRLAALFFGADLADFEPYLTGEKTLAELAEAGVATWLAKKAKTWVLRRTAKDDGTEETVLAREVELLDPLAAVRELNRVLGIVSEGRRHTGGIGIDMQGMSPEELQRLAHATGDGDITRAQQAPPDRKAANDGS